MWALARSRSSSLRCCHHPRQPASLRHILTIRLQIPARGSLRVVAEGPALALQMCFLKFPNGETTAETLKYMITSQSTFNNNRAILGKPIIRTESLTSRWVLGLSGQMSGIGTVLCYIRDVKSLLSNSSQQVQNGWWCIGEARPPPSF